VWAVGKPGLPDHDLALFEVIDMTLRDPMNRAAVPATKRAYKWYPGFTT
jgi:hypothetical protein